MVYTNSIGIVTVNCAVMQTGGQKNIKSNTKRLLLCQTSWGWNGPNSAQTGTGLTSQVKIAALNC